MANNTYTADYVRSVINKKREEKMDTSQPSHVFTAEYVRNVIDGKKQTEPLVKKGTPSSAGTKKATQTSQDLRPGLNDGALRRTTNENKANTKNSLETPFTKAERLGVEVLYTPEGLPYLSKKDVAKAEAKNVVVDANKFLADGYKMSDAEKIAAKEYAQKYLDEYNKGMRNRTISSDQQIEDMSNPDSQYMKMSRLLNKTKTGSAIGAGIVDSTMRGLDALGISDLMEKAERKITGNDNTVIETLKDFTSDSEDQNKLAYGAGYMATEALKSSAVADALGKTKTFSTLQGKAKTPLGKSTINVLGDLGVDTLLETVPNAVRDIREGKSADEVAKNAAKNIGMNAAFNVLGEGAQTGLGAIAKARAKNKIPELEDVVKPTPDLAPENIVEELTDPENVNVSGEDFLDEIAESTQKAKNIPKTRIAKDSKLSKMDKDISNLVKWYGDETAVSDLEELRTAMIDFESTGSMDALNRIGELTAKLDDNFRGKTYTYQSKYKKNGALKSKGVTYKYGDNVSVESVLEEALPAFDDIHQSKAASINMPQIVERVDNEIPYLRESVPADGKVREESHSMNIGKGRVNNVDEDVRNAFIDDPNLYTQLSNAETVAKAQQIYDSGNAQAEIYRMLDHKDPAAIPLGNKIVGDLIDEGRKDEAVELLRTMSTKLRESGQFSQAAAITMIKSDPETALRYVVRNIDDMNAAGKKKLGNKWKDFELTDAEMELFGNIKPGDAEAIKKAFESVGARLAKEYPVTTWEKIVELSKVGMLLNPRTNIRNIVSNWMLQPVRSLTDRVSALGQNAIHLVNPDFKVTQSITGGGKQEKQLATEVWNSVKDSLLENTSRYEDVKGAVKDKQIFKGSVASKAFDRIFPGAIERANKAMGKNVDDSLLETARNFTYFLLEKGDEPFVKNNFVNRLASYMKAQGIKNIDEIPEDAIMLAKEEALKATFKDDNNFTNMLSSIKKNLGKGGEVIMPFTKTPANLAMRGIDYSPAGIVNSIKKLKNGSDVSKFMDDLSKNITGSAAIALGFYLTKNGIITGALSSDKDEAAFQKQQGQVAYSIKIGDNYYSYDWAQPAAIPIILGASIAQSIEESDNEEKTALEKIESVANIAQQATTSAADAWVELSPLQTISDIFNTSYGNSVPENVINEVLEFPQRFIPSSAGALARTVDTTQRQTYSAENPVRTQIDTAISKIPFMSKTLPVAYDTWGREIKRSESTGEAAFAQMLNPGTLGNNVSTPIDGEIQRLYERTENAAVFPQKSKWTVDGNKLSNREYSNLQKEQGELSYKMAEALINGSSYNKLDDSIKAQTLADIYSLTKALAENSVVGKELSSTNKNLENLYTKQGADALVTYLRIGNTDGNGSGGALVKEDWENLLRQSDLTRLQKAYIFRMKYPKSENPFE